MLDGNEQVFAGKAGEVVGPVKTDLGPVIFRIKEIKPAETTSFEEAKPDLEIEYKLSESVKLIDGKIEDSEFTRCWRNFRGITKGIRFPGRKYFI